MRIPRDVNAGDLIKLLEKYGYRVVKQTGSHIKLAKEFFDSKHGITVPNHRPIKIGTLQAIAREIAAVNHIDVKEIYGQL